MSKQLKAALFYATILFCVSFVIQLLSGNPQWLATAVAHAITGGFGAFAGYHVGRADCKEEYEKRKE